MTEPIKTTGRKDPLPEESFYEDQIRFFSLSSIDGRAAQRQIGRAKVAVLGGGVIASHAISSLADSGLGSLRVAGDGTVTGRDVAGNALLMVEDVGRARAEAFSSRVNGRKNPQVKCEGVSADMTFGPGLLDIIQGMDCVLVCLDSPAPALLEAVNRAALQANVRWIAAQVYRGIGLVGPAVIPRQTSCYECYELRRRANLPNYEESMQYESRLRELPAIKSELVGPRPLAACIGGLVALEALRLISQRAFPQTAGRILRIDFFAPEMTYHRILRVPNCPACGYKRKALPAIK